ncbi:MULTISPECIES: LysM peptidoglycan-binding domain-containing protein [unclassified Idiomarina]|jgi:membrane-bound lytic murein transglycosylase D|uniref:LysM peptidoglycan-binding domain-containing protein n=1 Tax=unclassified Idiomarina TaxID=2614829 RepID=UPI000C917591|nr:MULTISPECIES: LysM peptidoglycan-binding domain-containing protein [unclassified Idiomarina]MAD52885.1 lytic transglycosylase [Idiomarinaceae bacterium]NQZ04204.1 LysM peptidoglycan-binding domain-containing protein [Idiomarina sp.]|tara:strand:- start:56 stop:1678 length:1623 start_codon:yes stop_codon:yes gene_type:complete
MNVRYKLLTSSVLSASLLTLSGCQVTSLLHSDENVSVNQSQPETTSATPVNIAELQPVPVEVTPDKSKSEKAEPVPIDDLWQRIRLKLAFQVPDNARVNSQRNWYLSHPEYLERVGKRAEPFLHLIVEEIDRRGMPMEFALLPIVESAFDPFAYSHGSASGVWQFIPSTARHYGLKIDWWYDGRRDVYAATRAALDYLEALHDYFDGNWLHALAAYNSGEGRVAAAIRRNKRKGEPTDFWNLDLPRETRAYVPKLLALADILANTDEYGIVWYPIENQPQLNVIEVPGQIDLALAADMAELPLETLHRYNSAYNRWATAPDGPHRLLLPQPNASIFESAINKTDPKDWLSWKRHKIRSGESLLTIAKKYNTSVDVIQSVNELNGALIRSGDYLLIPVATKDLEQYTLSSNQRRIAKQSKQYGKSKVNYQVQSGDTLWDISRAFNVGVRELASWNSMAPGDYLRPGQKLVIWQKGESAPQSTGILRTIIYQVRSGDSLARIANRFNVTISQIEQWNNISRSRYLQPGQRLTLKVDVVNVNS